MLATLGMDIHLTETYFIVAHFHYVMVGGMVSAFMAGLHFWWPKITGRLYPESLGRLAAVILFSSASILRSSRNSFLVILLCMPRRYHAYPPEFQALNVLSTAGASILAIGYVASISVFDLVAQVRADRWRKSLACNRIGVDDTIAASCREFSQSPNCRFRSL